MRNKHFGLGLVAIGLLAQLACVGSKFGSQKKERFYLTQKRNDVVLNAMARAHVQSHPPNLDARSRGLLSTYSGGIISLGISAVDSLISKSKRKYTATWEYAKNDFYFYDQPSSYGPFDPVGMQFTGFEINRYVKIDKHDYTAVHAEFLVNTDDSTASAQIINDGTFRLKVKEMKIKYAKAKVPFEKKYLNVDFLITFTTSYVTREGQFYKDVGLGTICFSLRKAPLDSASDPKAYNDYYAKLADSVLTGKSMIVPRSYGYYKTVDSTKKGFTLVPYWNQGNFSINVKVTESSKDNFTGVIFDSAGEIVTIEAGVLTAGGSKSSTSSSKKKK